MKRKTKEERMVQKSVALIAREEITPDVFDRFSLGKQHIALKCLLHTCLNNKTSNFYLWWMARDGGF